MRNIFTICIILLFGLEAQAQSEVNNIKTVAVIKASYIYNFAKNCKWDANAHDEQKFKIAVYGDKDLYLELLDKYSTRPINNQVIEVIWVQNIDNLFDEQILFLSKEKKDELNDLAYIAEQNNSLLITDFSGALTRGSIINFIVVDNTLEFEVDEQQAESSAVLLGTRIRNWANKIIGK